jgi:hypothetical protein
MLNKRALSIFPHFLRKLLGLNNPLKLIIDSREIIIPIDVQGSFPNLFLNKSWKTNGLKRGYFVLRTYPRLLVEVGDIGVIYLTNILLAKTFASGSFIAS